MRSINDENVNQETDLIIAEEQIYQHTHYSMYQLYVHTHTHTESLNQRRR